MPMMGTNLSTSSENDLHSTEGGKKDHAVGRRELLVDSGLTESLVVTCTESAGKLLCSNFGREVIYEVVTSGTGELLREAFSDKLDDLHGAIASLGALPKLEESEEHIFENFHSSRTIRKLILDCPKFAATLWKTALKGKPEMWAKGHRSESRCHEVVVSAFLESSNSEVRDLANSELQGLINSGVLKATPSRHFKQRLKLSSVGASITCPFSHGSFSTQQEEFCRQVRFLSSKINIMCSTTESVQMLWIKPVQF